MPKLVHIGVGSHATKDHLVPLADCLDAAQAPWTLAAVCDLDADRARDAAERYGFDRWYTDLERMFAEQKPDACVAITPANVTAELAVRLMRFGVPLLMEKPIGLTDADVRNVCDAAAEAPAPVMVSMNRRFDPQINAALQWVGDRPIRAASACMSRVGRTEPRFLEDTSLHAVDTLRYLVCRQWGDLALHDQASFGRGMGLIASFRGRAGQPVTLELAPDAGDWQERYELIGDGWRVRIDAGGRWLAWEEGKPVPVSDKDAAPPAVRRGAWAETVNFLDTVSQGSPAHPTPADVRRSHELVIELGRRRRAASTV